MCSISGIVEAGADSHPNRLKPLIEKLNAALVHRGPDDSGIVVESLRWGSVALGNTRLAIIDTSKAGHQPMNDPASRNWVTYNGETYNFRELRSELEDTSEPWVSHTDTEVVLRAYRRWGVGVFAKLRGMFALAIWDAERKELILARDRFGIKPLYYTIQNGSEEHRFAFASEVRALVASGLIAGKLDQVAVASYLTCGAVQGPQTIIYGIRSLLPGYYMRVKPFENGIEIEQHRYATSETEEFTGAGSRQEAIVRLRELLKESARAHLISDVPLGVFLSGGMDSSALVALLHLVSDKPLRTFSVVFSEPGFNESAHARRVAEKFSTQHQELPLTEAGLLELLPDAIAAMDQPTSDGVNTYILARAVKDAGVTVAISGLGGDELFAAYPSFRRALRLSSIPNISKKFLRLGSGFGKKVWSGSFRHAKFWQLAQSGGSPGAVYEISRQLFSPETVCDLTMAQDSERTAGYRSTNGSCDPVNAISRLELEGYMANTLLRDTDCMSMAHSLEVRVPFVDQEIAGFVLGLPGNWKLNGANRKQPKPLLAAAVSDLLPADLLRRPKMGFTLPFEKWLQSRLRDEVENKFRDERSMASSGIRPEAASKVWQRFLGAPRNVGWSRPWALYVLAKWCEVNKVVYED